MSTYEIDLGDDVKPATDFGGGPKVPPGAYTAAVAEAVLTRTKATAANPNAPMVTLKWRIAEGEFTGSEVRFDNVVFVPASAPFIKGRLVALGVKVPGRMNADDLAKYFSVQALGKMAEIRVADGKPNTEGKSYPQVIGIAPLAASTGVSNDAEVPEF